MSSEKKLLVRKVRQSGQETPPDPEMPMDVQLPVEIPADVQEAVRAAEPQEESRPRREPAKKQTARSSYLPDIHRSLPHSKDAEKGVLCSILISPALLKNGDVDLTTGDFYEPAHQIIYGEMLDIVEHTDRPLEYVSLTQGLRDKGLIDKAGGDASISELFTFVPTAMNVDYYTDIVREKAMLRKLIGTCTELVGRAYGEQGEVKHLLDEAEAKVAEIGVASGLGVQGRAAAPLSELQAPAVDPREELLKHRFLCRGGGALLVAPTGIGKSVLSMQCMILWSLGRTCFGITPARPLTSLLLQAENDSGDLWEMVHGVCAGLQLSERDREKAFAAIRFENLDSRTGRDFLRSDVSPLLRTHKPDLLWIDPVLAYLGGDASSQKDVSGFLRTGLNPLIHKYDCGCILVHHTAKPAKGEDRSEWGGNDFAYLGMGSSEWANWARAVIAVRGLKSNTTFELRLGKRGARVGWKNADGSSSFTRLIQHSASGICWVDADEDDLPEPTPRSKGRAKKHTIEKILSVFKDGEMTTTEWQKAAFNEKGVSRSTFFDLVEEAERSGIVRKSALDDKWTFKSEKSEKSEMSPI